MGEDAVEFFEQQREQQEKWVSGADGKRFRPVAAFAGTVRAQLRQQTSSAVVHGKTRNTKKKKQKRSNSVSSIHSHQDKVGEEIRLLTAGQSPTQTKALTVATTAPPTDDNGDENERWDLLMAESPSQRRAKERLVKTSGSKNRADVTKIKVLRRYNLQLKRYFKRFAIKVRW